MYALTSLDDVSPHELEGEAPTLLPVGLELQPEQMRPSVWQYDTGEENAYHRQDEQEELYMVLEGRVDVTLERDDSRDVVSLHQHDVLVVPPETWRQLRAVEPSTVLAIGAPNRADDGILEDDAH